MFGATFWIAVAMVTWDEYRKANFPPQPQRFMWVVVVWSVLGLVANAGAPQIASVFGFGILLAMGYRYLSQPSSPSAPVGGSVGKSITPKAS